MFYCAAQVKVGQLRAVFPTSAGLAAARLAEGGHLEMLQWARANGCEWDAETCANAAGGGHLKVLR